MIMFSRVNRALWGVLAVVVVLLSASRVYAATPTVTAALSGSGDGVIVNIVGDPNASVILNYLGVSSAVQMSALGVTNASGSFSTTVSTSQYGITPASLFYVTVNNQRSSSATWPYVTATSGTNSITLSQTSVTLTVGQTTTLTATNTTGGNLYLSTNSSPSIANVAVANNQISITANLVGSTSITVCSLANTSNCATATVTVQNTNVQPITFSQNNVTVGYSQNLAITVAGGTGVYTVASNSNSSLFTVTINGSTVNLYAGNMSGTAAITVCSSNMSSCGVINATASATASASALSFSIANPSLAPGQVMPITVTGGTGSYFISSNSNAAMVQANVVGNTLTLYGNAAGTATLSVCASSGGCGTVLVTVAAPGTSSISLGQTNVSLAPGQAASISISGRGNYFISGNTNSSIAAVTINGSSVVINAYSSGTANVTVCQGTNECAVLFVTVTGTTSGVNTGVITASQVVSVGQWINTMLSGGTSPYVISASPASTVTTNLTSGNILTVRGVYAGTATVSVCSTGGVGCTTIPVMVVANTAPVTTTPGGTSGKFQFTSALKVGSSGSEVSELQRRLMIEGVFSGSISGYYGAQTEAAVKRFQRLHGLEQLGRVGPGTREVLNK